MQGCESFRSGFGEYQHDQREDEGAESYGWLTTDFQRDESNQRCRRKIDEVIAEQYQADEPVGALQESFCKPCAAVSLPCLVA
jgi:hypothetical protein